MTDLPKTAYKTGEVCPVCGEEIWAVKVCGCIELKKPCRCKNEEAEEYEKTLEERKKRQAYEARLSWADIPGQFANSALREFKKRKGTEAAFQTVKNWVLNMEENLKTGKGLILSGPTGCGKTHLAVAAARACIQNGHTAVFWSVADNLERMMPGHGEEWEYAVLMEKANRAQVLILDDLGVEKTSEWTQKQLTVIIDRRYREKKPIIATTNCKADEMREHLGDRAFSRLIGMTSTEILTACDYRRNYD